MNRENRVKNKVIHLDWDSDFFGFSIGRIYANRLTGERLKKELEIAELENTEFVELFCDASDDKSTYSSESLGFHLADLRITFKKNLEQYIQEVHAQRDLIFRKAAQGDLNRLLTISKGLFKDSRYYRYQNFDRNKADFMFQIWTKKSVFGELDDEVYCLTDETNTDILAFCTLKYNDRAASIGLFGINSTYRRKGVGGLMLKRVFHLLYKRRVVEVAVITQGKNSAALHLYQNNGFRLTAINLCYYKWLE